jgi:putative ABC transport system ATP-binding protein
MDLSVTDLTAEYTSGGYTVRPVDSLDFDVPSGELALLLGASGCGKTTVLSMVARLLTPSAGRIRLGELDVTALTGHELATYRRRTVGVVFQAFNLVPSLTARENVQVALQAGGAARRDAKMRADAVLAHVGLTDRADHRPAKLSGGEQQRVAIARAIAHDPVVVLADEPTAHLDYIQVEGVLRLLRDLATPGRVVIVATHDDRLLPLADRIIELSARPSHEPRPPKSVELAPGEVLFEQGDPGDLVYVVDSGEVELFRVRDDGSEERIAAIQPGGYFGELAPTFGLRRSAGARAGAGPATVTGLIPTEFRRRRHMVAEP